MNAEKYTSNIIECARKIFEEKGRESYLIAKELILKEEFSYEPLRNAMEYLIEKVWRNFEHPALLSLACESVGGKPEDTSLFGACLVLITGAMDVHDDIIDQSRTKGSTLTVFGKFGRNLALLVGDALLVKGYNLLSEACEKLPKKKRRVVTKLVKQALFETGNAEAEETSLKGKWDADPKKCFNIVKRKSAIAEAAATIGAIIGDGCPKEISALSKYGRTLGILANLRNEFVDAYEVAELKNRMRNEYLPIPILCAFSDQKIKGRIISMLQRGLKSEDEAMKIAHAAMSTRKVLRLKNKMKNLAESAIESIAIIKNHEMKRKLSLLILANLEGL